MHCVVTAGPTAEPIDEVRRLTNASTGRLGGGLCQFLTAKGCRVTLLWSRMSVVPQPREVDRVREFTTTAELGACLEAAAGKEIDAVFHVAAVGDFTFGRVYERVGMKLIERQERKLDTARDLMVELKPTPKLIAGLVTWFPNALRVGWKYQMDGSKAQALESAIAQIGRNRTHACVVNGAAYGSGYGLVSGAGEGACRHLDTPAALYEGLWEFLRARAGTGNCAL